MSEEKRNDAQTEKGTGTESGERSESKPSTTGHAKGDAQTQQQEKTRQGERAAGGKSGAPATPSSASKPAKPAAGTKSTQSANPAAVSTSEQTAKAKPGEPASTSASANRPGQSASGSAKSESRGGGSKTKSAGESAGAPPPRHSAGNGRGGRSHRSALLVAIIAIIVAVVAVVAVIGSGWLWYRGQEKIASLDSRVATMEKSVQSNAQKVVMPRLSKFDQRLQSLASDNQQQSERLAAVKQSLSDMQQSVKSVQAQSAKLADRREGNASRWEVEQIESLLRAANERLQLYNDPQGARKALQLASDAIGRKGDPRLFEIRSKIVNEIAALRALPTPDIEGLSLQLAAMVKHVPDLPLASGVPSEYEQKSGGASKSDQADGDSDRLSFAYVKSEFTQGWAHFKKSVGNALSGMLTIRRADGKQRALLPPDQAFFLNQNLQLQLRTARLALLERNPQGYRDSLASANQWLGAYFDTSVPAVSGMREQLDQMRNVKLDWEAPDISASLTALRERLAQRQGGGGASRGSKGAAQAGAKGHGGTAAQSGEDTDQGGQ